MSEHLYSVEIEKIKGHEYEQSIFLNNDILELCPEESVAAIVDLIENTTLRIQSIIREGQKNEKGKVPSRKSLH